MKLLAILVEFPYPANHGGRCDISRRLEAFQKLGWDVHAITWTGGRLEAPIREGDLARMNSVVTDLELLELDRGARRVLNLVRWPSQAAGRWPSHLERERLLRKYRSASASFDAVWIDGIHAAPLGRWLAKQLAIPYFYRSHNIEFRYIGEQARLARGITRVSIAANLLGLRKLEEETLAEAALFFDISEPDLDYWRSKGLENGRLLSTLADPDMLELARSGDTETIASDIAFAGSLSLPNNLAGLEWYLAQVHPRVQKEIPDVNLLVAGRNPSRELVELVNKANGRVIANPERMEPVLLGCKVAINPIFHGSGVNIKMIDMMASGRPVVTTSKGMRGMPKEIVELLSVADQADDMAVAIINVLKQPPDRSSLERRLAIVAKYFGLEGSRESLETAAEFVRNQG